MNKVVFVKSYFLPVGENKAVKVPTGEKKKGLLGSETPIMREEQKWVQTGFSDCQIDTARLTKDLEEATERLNKDGYEIVTVTEVTSGNYSWRYSDQHSYGYGYGYSYTDGLMIVASQIKK